MKYQTQRSSWGYNHKLALQGPLLHLLYNELVNQLYGVFPTQHTHERGREAYQFVGLRKDAWDLSLQHAATPLVCLLGIPHYCLLCCVLCVCVCERERERESK